MLPHAAARPHVYLLLDVAAQLGDLVLAFLVELHLGGGGASGLLQTLSELLQLAGLPTAQRRQPYQDRWNELMNDTEIGGMGT